MKTKLILERKTQPVFMHEFQHVNIQHISDILNKIIKLYVNFK